MKTHVMSSNNSIMKKHMDKSTTTQPDSNSTKTHKDNHKKTHTVLFTDEIVCKMDSFKVKAEALFTDEASRNSNNSNNRLSHTVLFTDEIV